MSIVQHTLYYCWIRSIRATGWASTILYRRSICEAIRSSIKLSATSRAKRHSPHHLCKRWVTSFLSAKTPIDKGLPGIMLSMRGRKNKGAYRMAFRDLIMVAEQWTLLDCVVNKSVVFIFAVEWRRGGCVWMDSMATSPQLPAHSYVAQTTSTAPWAATH